MMMTSTALSLSDLSFLREVEKRSGAEVSACLQCHKCSAGCPVGKETDLRSSQIMRLVAFGEKASLLSSKAIWLCASCEACTSRCPMDIDVAAVIDTLRAMAKEEASALALPRVDIFNRSFLKSVSRHGRVFETGMMVAYSFKTMNLFSNLGRATKMLARGRLAFAPSKSRDRARVKALMKAAAKRGKAK
jgi:heterodisulfide reductase subunit C